MSGDAIVTVATDRELGLAVFKNLYALFQAMASGLGGEVDEGKNLSRHFSFPTNPMFKGVWAAQMTAENADHAINETIAGGSRER